MCHSTSISIVSTLQERLHRLLSHIPAPLPGARRPRQPRAVVIEGMDAKATHELIAAIKITSREATWRSIGTYAMNYLFKESIRSRRTIIFIKGPFTPSSFHHCPCSKDMCSQEIYHLWFGKYWSIKIRVHQDHDNQGNQMPVLFSVKWYDLGSVVLIPPFAIHFLHFLGILKVFFNS